MSAVEAVRWSADGGAVDIIDQRLLPGKLERRDLRTVGDLCDAIATLAVRGAPAIGVAGAMGLVVALAPFATDRREPFLQRARELADRIASVRPTAVNLSWAVRRVVSTGMETAGDGAAILAAMRDEATRILDEDRAMCRRIGEHGLSLLADGARVLTHCNAGALATAGIGTALAPVYVAAERGRRVAVFADETRPLLQGSRLTAWELDQMGIDVTVLADSMAASLMRDGRIDLVIVGADRIAANGDVANKVGTYPLAVLAARHEVPFLVAAPLSTVDLRTPDGTSIPIEERRPEEVLGNAAPPGADALNIAFDVTPAELVTAVVTEAGVLGHPLDEAIARVAGGRFA
jgi:methylthioribose-1-phosphate isomerase